MDVTEKYDIGKREIKYKYYFDSGDKDIENESEIFTLDQIETGEVEDWKSCCYLSSAREIAKVEYTGLKDKNGKEIYEGDVTVQGGNLAYVGWNKSQHRWTIYDIKRDDAAAHLHEDIEVIGNIFENPELLK